MALLTRVQGSPTARAWLVGTMATTAGLLTAAAMASGPGMTNDSVAYAAAARGVAEHTGMTSLDGGPFTTFPPGLPLILGMLMRTGLSLDTAATIIAVVLVVLTVTATYWLGAVSLRARTLALLPTAVVTAATPTVMLYSRLWSEPLFTCVTLLVLIVATRAVVSRTLTAASAALLAIGASAAVWIRYIGITLIPVAAVAAGLAVRSRGFRRAAIVGLGVGTVASLGAVSIVIRNVSFGDGPFGGRSSEGSTFAGFLVDTASTLGTYALPQPLSPLAIPVGMLIGSLLAWGAWRAFSARDAGMSMILWFIAVYWSALLIIGLLTTVEYMRYRLAAPAFAPLVILAVYAGRDVWRRSTGHARSTALVCAAVLLLLTIPVALAQSTAYAWIVGAAGHGYASRAATESELAAAVAQLPMSAGLATNDPAHLYWAAGRRAQSYRELRTDPGTADYLAVFTSTIAGTSRDTQTNPISDGLDVTVVAELDDGTLYRVRLSR